MGGGRPSHQSTIQAWTLAQKATVGSLRWRHNAPKSPHVSAAPGEVRGPQKASLGAQNVRCCDVQIGLGVATRVLGA